MTCFVLRTCTEHPVYGRAVFLAGLQAARRVVSYMPPGGHVRALFSDRCLHVALYPRILLGYNEHSLVSSGMARKYRNFRHYNIFPLSTLHWQIKVR